MVQGAIFAARAPERAPSLQPALRFYATPGNHTATLKEKYRSIYMNSLDEFPQCGDTHDTAESAETAFRAAIDQHKLFVIQQEDRRDYGTDLQIEARDGNSATNFRTHIQLKGTTSETNRDGSVSISVTRISFNYLLSQQKSIYVCYHIPSNQLFAQYAEDVYRE
jgi:hypothetical protein